MQTLRTRGNKYGGSLIIALITITFVIQVLTFVYRPWTLTHESQWLGPSETIYRHNNLVFLSAVGIILLSWIYTLPSQRGRYWYSKIIIILSMLVMFLHYQMKAPTYLG